MTWFLRVASHAGRERAAGCAADPSTAFGMTREDGRLRLDSLLAAGETAGPSTSVGMTIRLLGWSVSRFTCCGCHNIVIPTEVEGPAVFPAAEGLSWFAKKLDCDSCGKIMLEAFFKFSSSPGNFARFQPGPGPKAALSSNFRKEDDENPQMCAMPFVNQRFALYGSLCLVTKSFAANTARPPHLSNRTCLVATHQHQCRHCHGVWHRRHHR